MGVLHGSFCDYEFHSSDDMKPSNEIATGNAGWPVQFRFAVHVNWSRAPELDVHSKLFQCSNGNRTREPCTS